MESIWWKDVSFPRREPLSGDIKTEIAVVGAGMAGILTAWLLQQAGRQVVVLESGRTASGQTGHTTAKVTAQHGLIYRRLLREKGEERARQYAQVNQRAVERYRELIRREQIDCDWEEWNAYVYGDRREELMAEAEAAASLGLDVSYVSRVDLPVGNAGAVRFRGQAQFHPLKFLRPLAQGLTIYEHTPVLTAEDNALHTDRGTVEAEEIVFACHFPFVNVPGLYFARMHQERSYVLALEHAGQVDGMYLGVGERALSFRNYGPYLLLGGEGHRTGENSAGGRYDTLRKQAEALFPGCREAGRWSAQDCITPDGVPYIGRFSASRPHWYLATGFQKWGMTSSMAAAGLLTDLICGRSDSCGEVFDPARFSASDLAAVCREGGVAVKGLARRLFQVPRSAVEDLPPGHGGIVSLDGEKVGIYKDEAGRLYPVDVRCPHLGCQLEWNPDERSWDCPCHGSRFDYRGNLLSNPAQEKILWSGRGGNR